MPNRSGQVNTFLNGKELQMFEDYMKAKGISSKYLAAKQIIIEHLNNRIDFAEPSSVVAAIEKRADEIDKLTPKQAKTELQKFMERKGARRNISARSLYAPTTFNNLLRDLYEAKEPPARSVWFLLEYFNEEMLTFRALGERVRTKIGELHLEHYSTLRGLGRFKKRR